MSHSSSVRMAPADQLRDFMQQAFGKVGCSEDDASEASEVLLWASLRGVDTHGVRNLLPYYLKRIESGEINAQPQIEITQTTATAVRMNGDGGLGLVTAGKAMRQAIEKAADVGIGVATVMNTHHLGPAGYFASLPLEREMLGICVSGHFFFQVNEIGVPPVNSTQAMFSTNAVSFAAPPFLLDMATAATTVNRIESYAQAGQPIPSGWAKDAHGNPTNDPNLATLLNSLGGETLTGGHKGVALSMFVSILSGVLTGGWQQVQTELAPIFQQKTMGHFVAAIRVDQFMPAETFMASMDAMIDALLASPRVNPAEPIHYPGSQEHETRETRLREGIPIDQRLWEELKEVERELSLSVALG